MISEVHVRVVSLCIVNDIADTVTLDYCQHLHVVFINSWFAWSFVIVSIFFLRLAADQQSIVALGLNTSDLPPWVDYLIHCRLAAINPTGT